MREEPVASPCVLPNKQSFSFCCGNFVGSQCLGKKKILKSAPCWPPWPLSHGRYPLEFQASYRFSHIPIFHESGAVKFESRTSLEFASVHSNQTKIRTCCLLTTARSQLIYPGMVVISSEAAREHLSALGQRSGDG